MTLEIGACALLLFGTAGWLQLRNEEHDLLAVAENEALLLGRGLQTGFENAFRDKQIEDVDETLKALSHVDPSVAIFVFADDGKLAGASQGARPEAATVAAGARARIRNQPVMEFEPPDSPLVLRLGLRLSEEARGVATSIVLEKPLHELQRDLKATGRDIVLAVGIFIVAVAGLTWALARRYVGVPLGHLVANMQGVRAGNLQLPPRRRSTDEVGETQQEFERLVSDLETAKGRAERELEARRRIERGLQDADKLITLGQLSAVMAHEVGSPLQVLEGRARALRKHADDRAATVRTADLIVEQVARITRIVGQVLAITRRRPAVRSPLDAEGSVRSVMALLELEAKRLDVSLIFERTGRTEVVADADQIQQVALNLIRNALQASPSRTRVDVRLGGNEDQLVLEVQDRGPGIPQTARPQLFEPFFTTRADSGGTGLGLSVVKRIVLDHQGQVEFVENNESGCLVRVQIPRKELR